MSLVRRAAKRDQSEKAIVHCLRLSGWSWLPLSARDAPDGVLARDWVCLLAEIKTGNKPLRDGQERWHSEWRGSRPLVLRDVEDVIALNRLFSLVVFTVSDSAQRVLRASANYL